MPVLPISRSSVPDSVSFLLSFSCDEWAQRTALMGALFSHKHLSELPFSFLIFRAFGLIFDRLKSISTGGWGANKRWLKCRNWYWISAVEPMQIFLLLSEGSVPYYCLTWAFFFLFCFNGSLWASLPLCHFLSLCTLLDAWWHTYPHTGSLSSRLAIRFTPFSAHCETSKQLLSYSVLNHSYVLKQNKA